MRTKTKYKTDDGDLDPSDALKEQIEDLRAAEETQRQRQSRTPEQNDLAQALDKTVLPDVAKEWLIANPTFITNTEKNKAIAELHDDIVDSGVTAYSPAYFAILDHKLLNPVDKAISNAKAQVYEPESGNSTVVFDARKEPRKGLLTPGVHYSAPVSREVPQSNGRRALSDDPHSVDLTPAMKEAAKIAGISEKSYAEQVLRLKREKENGNYTGGQ